MKVAIIGHREVPKGSELVILIYQTVFDLVENEGADTFFFGSRSQFNTLCFEAVSEMQKIFPHIRRVYVRATYEHISKSYEDYLLKFYEETYYPDSVRNSHELCYVLRDAAMVEACDVLLTYCDQNYEPPRKRSKNRMMATIEATKKPKSGTHMAVRYAKKSKKRIINLCDVE